MSLDRWIENFLMKPVRIEIGRWAIGLMACIALAAVVFFGALVDRAAQPRPGWAAETAQAIAQLPDRAVTLVKTAGKDPMAAHVERFEGEGGFTASPGRQPSAGGLLLSRYDGDAHEGVAELIRLSDGAVLATYKPDYAALNARSNLAKNKITNLDVDRTPERYPIYHPIIETDGSIIFHGMDTPLSKIDRCSNILWTLDGLFHHAIERGPDGTYWTAGVITPPNMKAVGPDFQNDTIVQFSSNGEILFEKSVAKALIENGLSALLFGQGVYHDDPLHLNDVQPALADGCCWKKGDLFLSARDRSLLALYRPSTNKFLWYRQGPWMMQHDVDILDDHRIAVFSNNTRIGYYMTEVVQSNETYVYDFNTGVASSPFKDAYILNDIRATFEGQSEILDDDHIVVEESPFGRIVQMNRQGEIDWQFVNRSESGGLYRLHWSRYLPPALFEKLEGEAAARSCDL